MFVMRNFISSSIASILRNLVILVFVGSVSVHADTTGGQSPWVIADQVGRAGRLDSAVELMLLVPPGDTEYAHARFRLGFYSLDLYRDSAAITFLEQATALSHVDTPSWAGWAHFNLAKAYVLEKRWDSALAEFTAACPLESEGLTPKFVVEGGINPINLLPLSQTRGFVTYRYAPGTPAERDLADIQNLTESTIRRWCDFFGQGLPAGFSVTIYLYPPEVMSQIRHSESGRWREVITRYDDAEEFHTRLQHELEHVLSYLLDYRERSHFQADVFLREGLAEYFTPDRADISASEWVAFLEHNDLFETDIAAIVDPARFRKHEAFYTYKLAGAFTEWALSKFGADSFATLYTSPATADQSVGRSYADLVMEWEAGITYVPSEKDEEMAARYAWFRAVVDLDTEIRDALLKATRDTGARLPVLPLANYHYPGYLLAVVYEQVPGGLRTGDKIIAVDGVAITAGTLEDALRALLDSTCSRVTIFREGVFQTIDRPTLP